MLGSKVAYLLEDKNVKKFYFIKVYGSMHRT